MGQKELEAEMLEAFLAIEAQDAHVVARREVKVQEQAAVVETSVEQRRTMWGATGEIDATPRALDRLGNRLVPDPSMTDSEYIHQRASNPTKPNIGKVFVATNMTTLIGGLALVRRALDHHKRAAEWFKTAYEGLYGGGMSPALDMSKVRVDTSIMAHDNGEVARVDRGRALYDVMEAIGAEARDRIIACVVLGIPCGDYADVLPSGRKNRRQEAKATDALLDALDHVAELRGFKMRGAA